MWEPHLEHLPACCEVTVEGSQLCSTRCPSPLLPLTSASEMGNSPAPSPFLFSNFPSSLPHLPPGIHCCNLLPHGNPHGIRYPLIHFAPWHPQGNQRHLLCNSMSALHQGHGGVPSRDLPTHCKEQRAGKEQFGATGSWQRSACLRGGYKG